MGSIETREANKLNRQIAKLSMLEAEIQRKDKYVDHCVKKFSTFKFKPKLFDYDPEIANCDFVEKMVVPNGVFKGRLFWGHYQSTSLVFEPHGFCIMIDQKESEMHIGSFKQGKEFGP